jgi:ubiquinone/menaquinone biosynthesis C-methylase UbiE/uncharacterized protein YbaR (Trm112 family)
MDKDVIPLLRCPDTGSELDLAIRDDHDNQVVEGTLTSKSGGKQYPIREYIAEIMPSQPSKGVPDPRAWKARSLELETGFLTKLFSPFEISAFRNAVELSGEDWLLEVGCGRGRLSMHFTQIPQRHVCTDISFENLQICRDRIRNAGYRYTSWVRCDPLQLPFAADSFSKVFSAQLIAHLDQQTAAKEMLAEMARVCKATGGIALSGYSYDMFAAMRKDKSGVHKGGLHYTRFTREEFTDLLRSHLLVEEVSQKLQYIWVGNGVPMKEHSVRIT